MDIGPRKFSDAAPPPERSCGRSVTFPGCGGTKHADVARFLESQPYVFAVFTEPEIRVVVAKVVATPDVFGLDGW
jgi:hypothetical protein